MPRKKKASVSQQFEGSFNVKNFEEAINQIEAEHQVPREEIENIIKSSFDKACRDTLNPFKAEGLEDIRTETIIDEKNGQISTYTLRDVKNEDDIEDDLLEVSLEEAQEKDKDIKVGDVLREKVDYKEFNYLFFRKVIQNIQQKIAEATKAALLSQYNDRVGQIISGVVEKCDNGFTTIAINKVSSILTPQNTIPGEKFMVGDTVKVFLNGVSNGEGRDKSTQLLITRTSDKFLAKLFELEIPDIADGTVKIKSIVREPGVRSKVAVYSDSPEVDPTGACIGSDGKRIKDICTQLYNEKIDVIKYMESVPLYIAEALKPANVVGVVLNDETHKAIAVVRNEESKIAIGKRGVNVRLASRLVGYSIDIKEQDAAMAEHISYKSIEDIKRKLALERLDAEEERRLLEEDVEDEAEVVDEAIADETNYVEEVKEETPVVEEVKEVKEEPKKVEEVVEHVEITQKAKVSLAEIEKQIEEEKAKKSAPQPSYKKKKVEKVEEKEEVKEKVKPAPSAMPIYTQEELDEIEKEEEEEDYYDEDEYSEYDDDEYYEDK